MRNENLSYVTRLFLVIIFLLPIIIIDTRDKYWAEILTFYLVIIQSTLFIFLSKEPGATIFKTYFVFCYIFFGIVPLLEYINGITYWGGKEIYDETYVKINFLLLIVNFIYFIVYKLIIQKFRYVDNVVIIKKEVTKTNLITFLLLSFVSFVVMFNINNASLLSMLFRGGEYKEVVEMERWTGSVLGTVFRFIPAIIFIILVKEPKVSIIYKSIIFFIFILCASPLGMARFMVALLYLPLLLCLFPKLRHGNNLPIVFLGSIVLIFPFLENFRNFQGFDNILLVPKYEFFFSGHFDSYQSLARVVQSEFITFGRQLLGSLFFYVPRGIWETKPIGSGALIANNLHYDFLNVSMNFYGEGYINFGYVGVIAFSIILAAMSGLLDAKYTSLSLDKKAQTLRILPYFIYISLVFTLMRGDLNVAISLFVSIMVSFYIVKKSMLLTLSSKEC